MNTLDKMETNPTIRPLLVELLRRLDAGEPLFDGIKRRDLDGCGVRFQARDRIMTLDLNSTFTFPPRTLADAESEAPAEAKTLPHPQHVYLTDQGAVLVGVPQRGWGETNCVDWQKLRAAIAALNPWQPIETAPKDGTRILTCVLGSDGRAYDYQINEWNDPRAVADGNGIGSVGWWRSRPSRQPTHWHPLPPPPAKESTND